MEVLVIQFSDIHICNKTSNSILDKKNKIINAVRNEALGKKYIFMLFTGDITQSGAEDEYIIFIDFVDEIKREIEAYSGSKVYCVLVPGNHDCNHTKEHQPVRTSVIDQILKQKSNDEVNPQLVNHCCIVNCNFYEYAKYYEAGKVVMSDKLVRIVEYILGEFDEFNIVINCYNTSWLSEKHEEPGRIIFPLKNYDNLSFKNKSDLAVSLFHHPYHWHTPSSNRAFKTHIEDTSDMVFTGHEHNESYSQNSDVDGRNIEYIEGAILQHRMDSSRSGFNIVTIDIIEQQFKLKTYNWDKNMYKPTVDTDWIKYKRNCTLDKKNYTINSFFMKELTKPGASFTHPRKSLKLDDIYVYPDLEVFQQSETYTAYEDSRINASDLCKLKTNDNKFLITGENYSGKTTLCKKLYLEYYNQEYIPVFIEGHNISKTSIVDFNKLINSCFEKQYSKDMLEEFKQENKNKKIIIIDSFDNIKLNDKHKLKFLKEISDYYNNIIITGKQTLSILDVFVKKSNQEIEHVFKKFKQYSISTFSHVLRAKLIKKWITAGREDIIEREALLREVDSIERKINVIIGKNLIPPVPLFLLTLLQSNEVNTSHNLNSSTNGYYYDFLITVALSKINRKNDIIGVHLKFITRLANYMFENDIELLCEEEFRDFHKNFCEEKRISKHFGQFLDFEQLINNLRNVDIITYSYVGYKFSYNYIYYYCVAKHLADNISKDYIKQRIKSLCNELHKEAYGNIIVFLVYHTKDSFVIDTILQTAKKIFEDECPIKFEDDISKINKLMKNVPRIYFEEKSPEQFRDEERKQKDEGEYLEKKTTIESSNSSDQEDFDSEQFALLNSAFKMVEILGQIMKNYWAEIDDGDKLLQLGRETYMVGLRALNNIFLQLSENIDLIVSLIHEKITEESMEDKITEDQVKEMVFNFFRYIGYVFIKKISDSVGYDKLSEIFADIREGNNTIAIQTIDLSIKLDYYNDFPLNDIKKFTKRMSGNKLPYILLRQMVLRRLYLFDTDYRTKDQIGEMLGISSKTQLRIEHASKKDKPLTS